MIALLYPTKKALKDSVGQKPRYRETTMFTPEFESDGETRGVGPSEYERKWYATITCKGGRIVKVS